MSKETKSIIYPSKKIVVCRAAGNQITKSGLQLTAGEDKPETGEVICIGAGKLPMPVKVGDTIVFRKYTENRISLGGIEYNFIQFKDVLAVYVQKN